MKDTVRQFGNGRSYYTEKRGIPSQRDKETPMTSTPSLASSALHDAADLARDRRSSRGESRRLEGTPGAIETAARKLFERNGVKATTVGAIALEANVTRELVYYHFDNKEAVVQAVIDDYVEDLVESVIVWSESIAPDNPNNAHEALRSLVQTFRYALYDGERRPRPMISVLEELHIRDAFDVRATRETAEYLADHIAPLYADRYGIDLDLVFEMLCVAIFGLVGLVKVHPGITDDELMKVVAQTLRLGEPFAKAE